MFPLKTEERCNKTIKKPILVIGIKNFIFFICTPELERERTEVRNRSRLCLAVLQWLRIIYSHGETQNCTVYAIFRLFQFGIGGRAYAPVWCGLAPHGHHGIF